MAEAVFREIVKREGLQEKVQVDSAGTGHWHVGAVPHRGTRNILEENSIQFEGIRARQVETNDLTKFDYIIAMDSKNVADLKKLGAGSGYIGRLSDFVPDGSWEDVPDPYFTGNFQEVYGLVADGCERLITFIRNEHSI
jgi:protein-tyrosine phosphatase